MKSVKAKIILALVILILVGIGFGVTYYLHNSNKQEKSKEVVKKEKVNVNIEDKMYKPSPEELKNLKDKFDKLLKVNKDTVGYIYAPGTELDEPIVQTDNNETYLLKTFEGPNVPFLGSVFLNCNNKKDFSDNLTWVFGHGRGSKVNDHRMFNDVNYYNQQKYMDEHPFVVIQTPTKTNYYKVEFLDVVKEDTPLYKTEFDGVIDFDKYIKKAASEASVKAKDALINGFSNYVVLATCREDGPEKRTLLYCRKVSDLDLKDFIDKFKDKLKYKKTR